MAARPVKLKSIPQSLESPPSSIGDAFRLMDSGLRSYFQRTLRELTDVKEAIDKVLAVAITDADGVITYVNDRFCNLYQFSREEVVGKTHRIIKSGEHPQSFYKNLWDTIKAGKIYEGEIKNRAKDGSSQWAHTVIVPFVSEDGKVQQYVSFRTDITPIKEAEEQRFKLFKAESAAAAAEAAVQVRDRFVSMAAHELKTPITSLQMILDLIMQQPHLSGEEIRRVDHLVQMASFQTRRLTSIINDLLDLSQIAVGKLVLKKELVDLGKVVEDLIVYSKPDFEAAGCKVNLSVQKPIEGFWDKTRLEQVVINLISNAMKYGQQKPIQVSVEADQGTARIKVQDSGIGIPKEFQERIFERFERSKTVENYGGIGLGLWITQQIVNAHHGKIIVESEEGHGSTFTIEIPMTSPHQS